MLTLVNPATDAVIRQVPPTPAAAIEQLHEAARREQPAWAATSFSERSAIFARFGELLASRRDELARLTTEETGRPLSQTRGEIDGCSRRLKFFLAHTAGELQDELRTRAMAPGETEERICHEPLGVIANISAWNYPYFVGYNVLLPALLTGNSVLFKPSEFAINTGCGMVQALWDAGVPKDVLGLVLGDGSTGKTLLERPFQGVFFTGSHGVGVQIAQQVAHRLPRLQLELGGKDPAYVCDDADPIAAAEALAEGTFYNAGQSCCAVERIYVHQNQYERFVAALIAETSKWTPGDPSRPETTLGPMTRRQAAIDHLQAQLEDATTKGATIRIGGARVDGPGSFFEPTVVTEVSHEMRLMREETFGPLIGVMSVSSDEQAIELMDDTDLGLTAAVYTRDQARGEGILKRLDVGSGYVNCCDRVSPELPWSGRRGSGLGCTLSTYGIEAFLRPKALHLRRAL